MGKELILGKHTPVNKSIATCFTALAFKLNFYAT